MPAPRTRRAAVLASTVRPPCPRVDIGDRVSGRGGLAAARRRSTPRSPPDGRQGLLVGSVLLDQLLEDHRLLAAAADQAEVARSLPEDRPERQAVGAVAARDDGDEARRIDLRDTVLERGVAPEHACDPGLLGLGALVLAVVDDLAREPDLSCEPGQGPADVPGAEDHQARPGAPRLEQHLGRAAARHAESVGTLLGEHVALDPGAGAVAKERLQVGSDRRLEGAAADRAERRAVLADEHPGAGGPRRGAAGANDRGETAPPPRAHLVEEGFEDVAHGATWRTGAAACPRRSRRQRRRTRAARRARPSSPAP